MNNAVYSKTCKTCKQQKILFIRLASNKKYYLSWTYMSNYMSQKRFDNDLVAIPKSKVALTSNKVAYVGICILDLSEVLMNEFHYDYFKNKYGNNSDYY